MAPQGPQNMRQVERTKVPGPPGRVSLPRSCQVPSHGVDSCHWAQTPLRALLVLAVLGTGVQRGCNLLGPSLSCSTREGKKS